VRSNGTLVVWGFNSHTQTNVPPGVTNVAAATGGLAHSFALRTNRTVIAWGNNSSSQTNVLSDLTNVLAIATGSAHNLVIVDNATIIPTAPWFDTSPGTPQLTSTGLALRVKGLVGRGFVVLTATTNFVDWDLLTIRTSFVGDLNYVDASATNRPRRFYRISEQR
jgi:hypothetical protein